MWRAAVLPYNDAKDEQRECSSRVWFVSLCVCERGRCSCAGALLVRPTVLVQIM